MNDTKNATITGAFVGFGYENVKATIRANLIFDLEDGGSFVWETQIINIPHILEILDKTKWESLKGVNCVLYGDFPFGRDVKVEKISDILKNKNWVVKDPPKQLLNDMREYITKNDDEE